MKHFCVIWFCLMTVMLASCSTEVDLYAEGKDVPIVYGLLDAMSDTNFIKITHAIKPDDNPLNAAADPLQNDYPGKLDVCLTEFCNGDSIRQIFLDTITIHNKQEGLFYAPAQKLYFTTEPIYQNTPTKHYSYRLSIELPDRTLVTNAEMVGSDEFRITSGTADFSGGYLKALGELWFLPAENGGIYDVTMTFTFYERRTLTSDTVKRAIQWSLGRFYATQLAHQMDNDVFVVRYRHDCLYDELEKALGDDTLVPGLRRYITDRPITVTVQAGGEHLALYRYYHELSHGSFFDDGSYSVIDGAYGVFSSKMTKTKTLRLGGTTVPELTEKTKWGFKYIGT